MEFLECSAKDRTNIDELFHSVVKRVLDKVASGEIDVKVPVLFLYRTMVSGIPSTQAR